MLLHGRMGNQMFQFAFVHLLSKERKVNYLVQVDRHKYYLQLFNLPLPFKLFTFKLFYRIYNAIEKRLPVNRHIVMRDCKERIEIPIDINGLLFDGYFQDAAFYENRREELQQIFSIRKSYSSQFYKKYNSLFSEYKTLVVSMRLDEDYKNFYLSDLGNAPVLLPENWYVHILERIKKDYQKIIVISDRLDLARKIISGYDDIIFASEAPEIQFQLLMHANACIIPNSSFAWWGAFLNNRPEKKIYAPLHWAGYHAGIEYPAGIMTKEFIWV